MNLSLLIEFTKRDFAERYTGSLLGTSWAFIRPLVDILIYTVVFSKIMGSRLPGIESPFGYSIYLVAGIIPWTAFSNTIMRITTSFSDKKDIISKMNLNLSTFPLFILFSEAITYIITMSFYFIFLFVTGFGFSEYILFIPLIFVAHQILAYSLGIFFAVFNVFLKDIKELVGVIVQIWFWMTPIVYVFDILPSVVKNFMIFNPTFLFVHSYQSIFLYKSMPNINYIIAIIILGHVFALIAYLLFKFMEKDVRDFL